MNDIIQTPGRVVALIVRAITGKSPKVVECKPLQTGGEVGVVQYIVDYEFADEKEGVLVNQMLQMAMVALSDQLAELSYPHLGTHWCSQRQLRVFSSHEEIQVDGETLTLAVLAQMKQMLSDERERAMEEMRISMAKLKELNAADSLVFKTQRGLYRHALSH